MGLPETKILCAYLEVVKLAIVHARSLAYQGKSYEEIGNLLDAVHNIPELLQDWQGCDEDYVKSLLLEYDQKWKKDENSMSLSKCLEEYLSMQLIRPEETQIAGEGTGEQDRIFLLIKFCLRKIAKAKNGKTDLLKYKFDNRYWELYALNGEKLHVPPFGLRAIDKDAAIAKYGIK